MTSTDEPLRILLVDDSAVIRGALGQIVDAEPDLRVVGTARNGGVALDVLRQVSVDVVLLDIEMPEMDGLTALPLILAQCPGVRVIMASSLTQAGAASTLQALMTGASDYISKPPVGVTAADLIEKRREIIAKVRAVGKAGRVQRARRAAARSDATSEQPPVRVAASSNTSANAPRILAIAASTGGPNALADVLCALPADFPLPILITQHMPPGFTGMLAERLARDTGRECVEATDGIEVCARTSYVAPGDYHMLVRLVAGRPRIQLMQSEPENHCRPAADPMLRSVAQLYGASALALVLTGMGEDGMRGCADVRARGGRVIAQDESTSVVWGMPGAVVNAGLADNVLPISEIPRQIASLCLAPSA